MSRALEQLGDAVRRAQDEALARGDDLAQVDARLFPSDTTAPRRLTGGSRRGLVVALAAAAAVMLIVGWQWLAPLRFHIDGKSGTVSQRIEVAPGGEAALTFSDGTDVRFAGGSQASVVEITRRGARVEIERGRATVSVTHGRSGDWHFVSGPFDVHVTGTRFDVIWDPDDQHFTLVLHEGSVSVTGPSLDGRVVSAGESLEIDLEKRVAQDTKPTPPSNDPAPQPTDDIDDTSPAPSAAPSGPTWQELARGARYDEAWAAVEAVGFDTLCERVSAGEIMALADIARYAGKGDRAPHAYTTVRRRFPGSAEAALAAFTLGRMAFHGGGGYGSAIRWFNVYLQEAPNGPLAREALGRIMEAHHNSGSVAAARATAKQYLTTYPKGPHAPLARQIAGP